MSQIKDFIDLLIKRYGSKIEIKKSTYDEETVSLVPDALREFYREYDSAEFPFGYIYTIEDALKKSKAEPFNSEGWFCFGFDKYFSFWLCRLTPDEENLSFTSWDHDLHGEIEAADEKLVVFLQEELEEYEENRNIGSVVLESLPEDKLKFLAKVRKVFSLAVTTGELMKEIETLPFYVAEDIPYAEAEEMIDETGHPECFSFVN